MSAWHLLRKLELAVVVGIKHAAQMGNLDARLHVWTRFVRCRSHAGMAQLRAVRRAG
jgi:hypothetical protein